MRPTTSFTIHAILAACLAALAASSAAAGKEQVYYTITLTNARATDSGGQQLGVQSFQWGPQQSALKLDRNYVKSWSTSGDAQSGGGQNELGMDDTAGKERDAASSGRVTGIVSDPADPAATGASERITVGGSHAEGQATGKRQHKPLVARGYYDTSTPPPRGSLTVLASGPCQVGTRYPSMTLNGGGKSYVLQEVRVADCGTATAGPEEQITFVYGKVTVRGWDPQKKEQ
jgi:hypothetical protein